MMNSQNRFRDVCALVICVLLASGCASNKPGSKQIFLMPAPDVYEEGQIEPWIDNDPISRGVAPEILFATDRKPAEPGDTRYDDYTHERGNVVRLGSADIMLGHDEDMTWEEARRVSLLKNRTEDYPLQVSNVETFGVLAESVSAMDDTTESSDEPGQRFADEINRRLAIAHNKDVYIYVHGYKVNFENPLLVASELWHFLGYNGAFIAYAWPTKFSVWNYLVSVDTAKNSARGLRTLILFISRNTDVERIHVIGYSMGTRTVSRMLADLGMYGYQMEKDEIHQHVRLGQVYLIGSDVDRNIIGGYLQDGALRIPDSLTIYVSSADSALDMSKKVFGRDRTGQRVDDIQLGPRSRQFFEDHPQLRIIDVTDAEGGTSGNGHSYFRSSPWVSSDILMSLLYDLTPEDRGLMRRDHLPIYSFPPDYVDKLRATLIRLNPALKMEP